MLRGDGFLRVCAFIYKLLVIGSSVVVAASTCLRVLHLDLRGGASDRDLHLDLRGGASECACALQLLAHEDRINCIAATATSVLSGSSDGSVCVWRV